MDRVIKGAITSIATRALVECFSICSSCIRLSTIATIVDEPSEVVNNEHAIYILANDHIGIYTYKLALASIGPYHKLILNNYTHDLYEYIYTLLSICKYDLHTVNDIASMILPVFEYNSDYYSINVFLNKILFSIETLAETPSEIYLDSSCDESDSD